MNRVAPLMVLFPGSVRSAVGGGAGPVLLWWRVAPNRILGQASWGVELSVTEITGYGGQVVPSSTAPY